MILRWLTGQACPLTASDIQRRPTAEFDTTLADFARARAALGARPPLGADLPQVRLEVHTDGVPGGPGVPPGGRGAIPGDLTVHRGLRRQERPALEQVCHPVRLRFGDRHDRPDRLDEPDEVQPGNLRRDDAAVERDLVLLDARHASIAKRETDLVAGALNQA